MTLSFRRLIGLCLFAPALFAQSVHNGSFSVLGDFDASGGTSSKPFTTATSDPTGSCSNPFAVVLNTSSGSQAGHLSACLNGAWLIVGGGSTAAPSAGMVKSTGTSLVTATAGIDYQSPITFPLAVNLGGTGTTTPSLIGGAGISITGTWPNQTVTAVGGGGGGTNALFLQGNAVAAGTPTQANQTYLWNTTNNDFELGNVSSALSTTGFGNFVLATGASLVSPSFGLTGPTLTYTAGASGVLANRLVVTDSNGNAITAPAGGGSFGIATATVTSGNTVEIQTTGLGQCMMDGASTIGHLAVISNTNAGYCTDSGVTASSSIPTTTRVVGMIRTATTASGQLARVQIHGPGVFGTQGSGGGGGGATNLSGLTDYAETTNPNGLTAVTFQPGVSFPYNNQTCSFATNHTVTISGSASDTLYIYVTGSCQRTLGYSSANTYTLTNFENSTPQSGISAFPSGSFHLEKCTVVSGHFSGACTTQLPFLSQTNFTAGAATTPVLNASGVSINVGFPITVQSGTNYSVSQSDQGSVLEFTNTASVSVVIPQAVTPGSGNFQNGWFAIISNVATSGANAVTVTPNTSQINGASSLSIADGATYLIVSEGTTRSANGSYAAYQIGGVTGGGGGGGVTAPLALSAGVTGSSPTSGILDLTNTTTTGYTDMWFHGGKVYRVGSGNSSTSAPYTNAFFILDQTDSTLISTYTPTTNTWAFPGTENVTIGGNLTVTGTCTGCGGAGSGGSFSSISAGTNTSALVIGSGGSLTATGTGTINATNGMVAKTPYACINNTTFCYDPKDGFSQVVKPVSPSWINNSAPATIIAGTNGNYTFSTVAVGAYFLSSTATTSAETTYEFIPGLNTGNSITGVWLWDSTNSKLQVCGQGMVSSTGIGGMSLYTYNYSGSGNPSYSSSASGILLYPQHPHLRAIVSGTTLSCQVSADGGQSFYTFQTTSVGTISKGGVMLLNGTMNLMSLNVQ